jgi:hypothetical protein
MSIINAIKPVNKITKNLDKLKACLDYNPETGDFYWIPRPREDFGTVAAWNSWNSRFAGKKAGTEESGKRQLRFQGISYEMPRLAYILSGHPIGENEVITFKDGKRSNLAFDNLVKISRAERSRQLAHTFKPAERRWENRKAAP